MTFRPMVLAVAAILIGGFIGTADAAARRHKRHRPSPVDMTLRQPRPAPAYYGQTDDGYYPSPYSPARPTRQRSWFRQGPVPSINDSLEGLPPNVTDPPNVRTPGDRR